MKQDQETNSIRKQGYKAPKLTVYGSIKDLTRQTATGFKDDKGANMMGS